MTEPNFDLIARPYRWLEYLTFGRALERCRNHFLPRLLQQRRALVFGDGDGRFLAALLAANPQLQTDAVDISAAMLRLLEKRANAVTSGPSRLHTHRTSALNFAPSGDYDLIVTHFFLDCLTAQQLHLLCARLRPHLAPGAVWLISDFRVPPAGPMRWPARALVRSLYLGFRILTGLRTTTLPDHSAALTGARLDCIAQRHLLMGLLTTELWQYNSIASRPAEYTSPMLPPQRQKTSTVPDPVPDPEPASPSLDAPDPGVFHHEPAKPPAHDPAAD